MMTNKPHAWLFVDGSCGAHDDMGGWCGIAVSRAGHRKLFYGTACPTTISRCELMPIIEGVEWIAKNWAHRMRGFRLNVYSDSEYTVKTLNGEYNANKNKGLWRGMTELIKLPINYKFIWVARNTLPYMDICDAVAGAARKGGIAAMGKQFKDLPHRDAINAVPVVDLPDDYNTTSLPEEIRCQNLQNPGVSYTPQIPSLDLNNMD